MNFPSPENVTGSPASDSTLPSLRLATRLAFFVAGMGIACWAPLVPYAKEKLGLDEAGLGMMLLSWARAPSPPCRWRVGWRAGSAAGR